MRRANSAPGASRGTLPRDRRWWPPGDTRVTKPERALDYDVGDLESVRRTCLYVATVLGDLMDDRLVVVGGFVPALLVPQDRLPNGATRHVGTTDLDLALSIALLAEEQYHEVSERLRRAGFRSGTNARGNPTSPRWVIDRGGARVQVDFLMPPGNALDHGGGLIRLESDFAAFVSPGLDIAWRDRRRVSLDGYTILGERATREVWVCGPGAFIVLKALAWRDRGEPKDAYDLFYVLRNYGDGPASVADAFRPLLGDAHADRALGIVEQDFGEPDCAGPARVAAFLGPGDDETVRADVAAFAREFVRGCVAPAGPGVRA